MKFLRRLWQVFDDRTGTSKLIGPVIEHPVPDAKGWVGWSYALGSAVLFAFIVQVVTGIALATVYIPSTGSAFDSLQFISNTATLGSLLRGMHNYGATAMIVFMGLHLIQTFLIGAYKFPREANWLTGTVLLAFTVALGFTGQLLRWDQNAYWSVFVLASQAGRTPIIGEQVVKLVLAGNTVGGATLSRFYAYHVFFLPAMLFLFLALHLWLVIHNGVSEPPEAGRPVNPKTYRAWYQQLLHREGVPFWPDALWRDVVLGLVVLIGIVALAVVVGAPKVDVPPDPTLLEAYPRPDWYFLWIFAALALVPPSLEDYIILGGPMLTAALLIFLPFIANKGERSPKRRPWAFVVVMLALIMIGTLNIAGLRAPWSPDFNAPPLSASVIDSPDPEVVQGATLFNDKSCQSCHTIAGDGGQRGPDLTFVGDRLTRDQIILRILNGGGGMPAYAGTISPEELSALTAFLETRKAPPVGGEPLPRAGR